MTTPLIDVLIPVHDNVKWLQLCLRSLESFTKNHHRVIVLDNNSQEDETQDFLEHLDGTECLRSTITLVRRGVNDSFSDSINAGLHLATAPYVCLLNSDVIVQPGWDQCMIAEAGRPDVGLTGARGGGPSEPTHTDVAPWLVFFCVMGRKEVFDKAGPLDSKTCKGWGGGEDLDYSWRVQDLGLKTILSKARVFHGVSRTYEASGIAPLRKSAMEAQNLHRLQAKWGADRFRKGTKNKTNLLWAEINRTPWLMRQFADCYFEAVRKVPQGVRLQKARMDRHMPDMARETMFNQARLPEYDSDYVLFVDDDQTFPDDLVSRLLAHDVDVVAALVYKRGPPHDPVAYKLLESGSYQSLSGIEHTGLREVDAVGFGCVLIKRAVIEKTRLDPWLDDRKWFRFGLYGEDMGFCNAAKRAGFKIHVDTDLILGHLGDSVNVDEAFVKAYKEKTFTGSGTFQPPAGAR